MPSNSGEKKLGFAIVLLCLAVSASNSLPAITVKASPPKSAALAQIRAGKFNGKLAFVSNRHNDGGLSIWTMNADGSSPIRLTDDNSRTKRLPPFVHVYDGDPVWSPDGTRIAFVSNRDYLIGVYIMNADGSDAHLVTDKVQDPGALAWSPDGSKIAFSGGVRIVPGIQGAHPSVQIYTMNIDGSQLTKLTTEGFMNEGPAWSPDGKQISFTGNRDPDVRWGVWVMNSDGNEQKKLTNVHGTLPAWSAAWSPDGSKIAFGGYLNGNWEIFVMNADGTDERPITNDPKRTGRFGQPKWSPDGTKIVTTLGPVKGRSDPGQGTAIILMNADGSNQINLSNRTERLFVDTSPDWQPLAAPLVSTSSIIGFTTESYRAYKDSDSVMLTVKRTGNLNDEASCSYYRHEGRPPDIRTELGRLRFAPGESAKTISVPLSYSDAFKLTLSDNEGNASFIGGIQEATVTVIARAASPKTPWR